MQLQVRRLAVRASPPELLVEYSVGPGAPPSPASFAPYRTSPTLSLSPAPPQQPAPAAAAVRHVVIELRRDALQQAASAGEGGAAQLARRLRAAFPQLLPQLAVSDSALVQLLRPLLPPPSPSAASAAAPPPAPAPPPPAPAPPSVLAAIEGIGDLQRARPAALQAAKARMEVVFEAHRVAPGDPRFVYDKRVDFTTRVAESSDWDD